MLDGHVASLIIVAARTDAGVSLFAVDGDAAGLERTALSTMDQTRKQAKLELFRHAGGADRQRGRWLGRAVDGCSTSPP